MGYRVSSKRATQFRQWATRVLKNHLIQGYTLNQRRLLEHGIKFEQAVNLLSCTLTNQALVSDEGEATALFGQLRGDGLASSIATIEQGFADELFYPNIASRAAHLGTAGCRALTEQKALMIRLVEHFILLKEPSSR